MWNKIDKLVTWYSRTKFYGRFENLLYFLIHGNETGTPEPAARHSFVAFAVLTLLSIGIFIYGYPAVLYLLILFISFNMLVFVVEYHHMVDLLISKHNAEIEAAMTALNEQDEPKADLV